MNGGTDTDTEGEGEGEGEPLEDRLRRLSPSDLQVLLWQLRRRPAQVPPCAYDPPCAPAGETGGGGGCLTEGPGHLPYGWFFRGGRGSGKTLAAASHIYELTVTPNQQRGASPIQRAQPIRVALIGETHKDVRNTLFEGQTGLLNQVPRSDHINYNRSLGEFRYRTPNGREVHVQGFSGEEPDDLRGPQFHIAWVDEPAKFRDAHLNPQLEGTVFSNLQLALRLQFPGPHLVVTGTPTPCRLILYLRDHPYIRKTHGTTFDNESNLPPATVAEYRRLPPGSRTARQELYAEILEDNPDALFSAAEVDTYRADPPPPPDRPLRPGDGDGDGDGVSGSGSGPAPGPEPGPAPAPGPLFRVPGPAPGPLFRVLGYDPSVSANPDADEAGLILTAYRPAAAAAGRDELTHAYPVHDFSGSYTPAEQTARIMDILHAYRPETLVFEQNQGVQFLLDALLNQLRADPRFQFISSRQLPPKKADYGSIKRFKVALTLKNTAPAEPYILHVHAIHASVNKQVRAEAVAPRYSTGQVHHPTDPARLQKLEDQMFSWTPAGAEPGRRRPARSPDRLDALCYTLLHVFSGAAAPRRAPLRLPGPAAAAHTPAGTRRRRVSVYSADAGERMLGIRFNADGDPVPDSYALLLQDHPPAPY